MRKAMATGIAMIMNVQDIQAVLWTVKNFVSGIRYTGIGPASDKIAIRDTVTGKPSDWGHQLRL
jgi:hypothetical protein